MCKTAPSTNFQGLPRPGRSGLDLPILQDPAQETSKNSSSLGAVCPGTGNGRPFRPAPVSFAVASIAPSTLDLSQIPSRELDRFIQDHLKPSPLFQKQVSKAIDVILGCLREKCVHKASRVSKVSPPGGDTNRALMGGPPWGQEEVTDTGWLRTEEVDMEGSLLAGGTYLFASFFFFFFFT